MLNYVWIGLIVIGILVAVGNDVSDEIRDPYRNGRALEATFEVQQSSAAAAQRWQGELVISGAAFNAFYGTNVKAAEVRQKAEISVTASGKKTLTLLADEATPKPWSLMAANASQKGKLSATVESMTLSPDGKSASVRMVFEPIRFVKIRAVTQAALDYAATAVSIAIGLIGIMALWLGVMKVAEEAGLIRILTRALMPLTRRLFPDVPPDHPAVGAMIMNISANMLGLSNAATPLGLKAMEELNKLSPKAGTATNAMCTFLAINTGGLILIPATAIAVRAAAGSANPGIIIGTSIFGASCATIAGVVAAKVLEKLPVYKRQLLPDPEPRKEDDHG